MPKVPNQKPVPGNGPEDAQLASVADDVQLAATSEQPTVVAATKPAARGKAKPAARAKVKSVASVKPTPEAELTPEAEPPDANEPVATSAPAVGAGDDAAGQPSGGDGPKPDAKSTGEAARDWLSGAKGRASSVAADARDRASNADVGGFARSTTSLIATARPFFLAGAAAVFSVLGFLEGDSGTSQLFVFGAILFVLGAAFSAELTAWISARLGGTDADTQP